MTDTMSFSAVPRQRTGKGGARSARRSGRVPAVIYGNKEDQVLVEVESKLLARAYHAGGFFSHVFEVQVEGKKERVLAREAQTDPVTGALLHVDFLRFSARTRVEVDVDVDFVNEEDAPGLKKGGMLNVVSHSIPLDCQADAIPEAIVVDLTGLQVGDVIHVNDLKLPANVTYAGGDPEATVATIAAPTVEVEPEAEEAVEEVAEADESPAERDEERS